MLRLSINKLKIMKNLKVIVVQEEICVNIFKFLLIFVKNDMKVIVGFVIVIVILLFNLFQCSCVEVLKNSYFFSEVRYRIEIFNYEDLSFY